MSYGCRFAKFVTHVYTNDKHSNIEGFLEPFDKNIWICLWVFSFITLIVVRAKLKVNFSGLIWCIFTLFLSDKSRAITKNFSKALFTIHASAHFLVYCLFLLGQINQENVFACIVTKNVPNFPTQVS